MADGDASVSIQTHRFTFDASLLLPANEPFAMPLARLMMATDDVLHLQRLLLVQHDPEDPTPSEKAMLEGEVGHLFRLLSGHLFEAISVFATLDSKCASLLDASIRSPQSDDERQRASRALELVRRGRQEILSNKGRRAFIAVVRNLVAFHYPPDQKLRRTIDKHLDASRSDGRLQGIFVLSAEQGIGRYSIMDEVGKFFIADEIGDSWSDFQRRYMESIGDAIELAGALKDVVDFLLTHLVTTRGIAAEHTSDIVRIHPVLTRMRAMRSSGDGPTR
jgi:hypothetical protein